MSDVLRPDGFAGTAGMHLEFVVVGVPISNQSAGSPALQAWRKAVEDKAREVWTAAPLPGKLKAVIINFHAGDRPSLDLDNMSKPILDVMQGLVYHDDRQIRQAELSHVRIDAPFVIFKASEAIVNAARAGNEFVYVRIEDAVDPLPLPR
jgi:Holliday junction resolvase RusA-like endonuclease